MISILASLFRTQCI